MARSSVVVFLKGWPASCRCYPCMLAGLLLVLLVVLQMGSGAVAHPITLDSVTFGVKNKALQTAGGQRFKLEVGTDFAVQVLRNATEFAWKVFGQGPEERKYDVPRITLGVTPGPGIDLTYAFGGTIVVGHQYVENVPNAREAITKTCFRLVAYVWHPHGKGQPEGLVLGIGMYVALKSGVQPALVNPGTGKRWDQGDFVTALFLEYCASFRSTFVADIIRLINKDGYSDSYFHTLLGKTVDHLWVNYKAKYGWVGRQ